jgi:protoheme IX farnesyltransferase
VRDYIELTKPRLSLLVWVTSLAGYFMAPAGTTARGLAAMLIGTVLVVGGANALNQVHERAADALMRRTRDRPLPAGRLDAAQARVFGATIALVGTGLLATLVNPLTAALAFAGFALYVFVYTPMKRRSTLCTLVGAVPGAVPPLIGWAAATGALNRAAWILFAILLLWQMPHFLAIARLYREDYRRGGMVMRGIEDDDGPRAYRQMVTYAAALLLASLAMPLTGVVGSLYLAGATVLGLGFIVVATNALRHDDRSSDRAVFLYSLAYLPLLLGVMLIDKGLIQ